MPALAVFSAVLSKVGAYGFLRVVLPIFPDATIEFQEVILVIALASILYGSVMAFTQNSARLVAGYSSVAQLGFITLGIFALRPDGADGAVLQMVNHGLVIAPLLLIMVILAERAGHRRHHEDGRARAAGAGAGGPVPDRHPGAARDARLRQLHRRVLHPQRRLPGEDRVRARRLARRSRWRPTTPCASTSARCTTASRTGVESKEIPWREGAIVGALVACIVALALYPQLILKRTDDSVNATVDSVERTSDEVATRP